MRAKSVLLAAVVLSVCGDVLELYAAAAPRWSRGDGRGMERWTAAVVGRRPARYDRVQTGEDVGERGELPIVRARRAMRESETGRVRTPRQVQVSTDLSMILLREMLKEARQKLQEEKSRSHNQNLFNMIG
ncbi:Hypp7907 [Branchiostoma lanceolatum]|uniref:Hypp7907 protein n=1 Tax=Branchiostoma lanceolatum TaxID=7740 RepID=A0A8K0EFV8_BRALA|nr:Hypp7907 [Branchiostoma lanceolatum]